MPIAYIDVPPGIRVDAKKLSRSGPMSLRSACGQYL